MTYKVGKRESEHGHMHSSHIFSVKNYLRIGKIYATAAGAELNTRQTSYRWFLNFVVVVVSLPA
jgi:hypothetical protein